MQDYRDLVAVVFGLVCAGIMLVGGQLYLEYGRSQSIAIDTDRQRSPALPLISRSSPPIERPVGLGALHRGSGNS